MTAYYNEIDPYCAQWLRNLMAQGLIADGHVDERSISDVTPNDVRGYTQCHFFAGLGGWSGALRLAAWPDHRPVWTGSCPCQPFSLAGKQGAFADKRHLWPDWFWLIEKCRPAVVLGEQVASAGEWLRLVRGDLEALGYAVGCIPMEAASAGADHLRDRYWFVADSDSIRSDKINPDTRGRGQRGGAEQGTGLGGARYGVALADADDAGLQRRGLLPERAGERVAGANGVADADQPGDSEERQQRSGQLRGAGGDQEACDWVIGADGKARRVKSGIRLLAHGVPNRVAKLRAFGNAIDLRPAAAFIQVVM